MEAMSGDMAKMNYQFLKTHFCLLFEWSLKTGLTVQLFGNFLDGQITQRLLKMEMDSKYINICFQHESQLIKLISQNTLIDLRTKRQI